MEKTYNPKENEKRLYEKWEKENCFAAKPNSQKEPFTIMMPPPNANGRLHIGHAVGITIQDIMIRFNRMKGKEALWLPGTDHAGIQTQVVFEKKLEKEGKSRFDLGREDFVRQCYQFTKENSQAIEEQIKSFGASCDWKRKKFTLDPDVSATVFNTFEKMHHDNLLYQDERIINWCPRCETALSDLEVDYKEREDKLTYIQYPLKDKDNEHIKVATTRPETMLGDTAVAVNPEDKRYKSLIGEKVILPLVKREIPIIADESVDKDFGTGAVKVTPGHSQADFEIGERHNLEIVSVIGKYFKMTKNAGKYEKMKINKAREAIISDLEDLNLIDKIETLKHSVGVCERCKTIVENLVQKQWFVDAKKLAKPAIKAVKDKNIKIIPHRFEKIYLNWMENIRDWCISRQIWWGHRIPVWYCQDCKETIVSAKWATEDFKNIEDVSRETSNKKRLCTKCKSNNLKRDNDVLDTWFSSGQWPFSTLNYPSSKDYNYFYPTTVMETAWDILFFWVARMIMMGEYVTKKIPFKYVYLHGLIRDKDRQKMSKSKGNVIDPLGVADTYGTDAVRMALIFGTGLGNDIVISEDKIRGFRNFGNKIWNASRFLIFNFGDDVKKLSRKNVSRETFSSQHLHKEDEKILKELEKVKKKVTKSMEEFKFHFAAEEIYNFFWHSFCDKYIESSKSRLNSEEKETVQKILYKVLTESLIILHPFMPFVTEAIWENLEEESLLILENWEV